MKVVFGGACITSGTGKLGGIVIQGGPYGAVARINFKPKNRQTNNQFQPCEKEAFTNVAKEWRSLSPTEIIAWNSFATPPATGYTTFLKFNLQYYRINNAFLITPPTLPAAPSSIILNSAVFNPPFQYKLTATYSASSNPNVLHLFVSNNNPLGQTKLVKSRLRLVTTIPATIGSFVYTFNPALYGVGALTGMSAFIGVRLFDSVTGFLSPLETIQFNT